MCDHDEINLKCIDTVQPELSDYFFIFARIYVDCRLWYVNDLTLKVSKRMKKKKKKELVHIGKIKAFSSKVTVQCECYSRNQIVSDMSKCIDPFDKLIN